MKNLKVVKYILPWLTFIAIFVVLFTKIDLELVMAQIKQVDLRLFVSALALSIFSDVFIAGEKYKWILKGLGCHIPLGEAILIKIGSLPIKSILPMKLGELTRAAYLKQRHSLSYPRGVASVLLGYVLNCFVLLLFILVAWTIHYPHLRFIIYYSSLLVIGLAFCLGWLARSSFFKRWLARHRYAQKILDALKQEYSPKIVLVLFFCSLGVVSCKLFNTWLIFAAFGIRVPWGLFFIFAPLSLFLSTLPITFEGLGARESAILIFFADQAQPAKLLGAGMLISFANRIFPILVGLLFLKSFLSRLVEKPKSTI